MSTVGSCPHCQANDVIAELCEHLDPSVAVGRRAGFSLESLWLSRGSAGLTAAISTKTPPLASGEVVSTSPASEQVFVVTAGRRAGYLLESFELSWGPAGLATTAASAASAVDHRLEKSRSVQPDSDIIATSARTSSQSSTLNLMNASSEASLSTAPARTLWTHLCSSISVAVPRRTVRSGRACTWKDSLLVLPRICRCVILLCSLMCFDSCSFCICSLNYCGLNLCALRCTRNFF